MFTIWNFDTCVDVLPFTMMFFFTMSIDISGLLHFLPHLSFLYLWRHILSGQHLWIDFSIITPIFWLMFLLLSSFFFIRAITSFWPRRWFIKFTSRSNISWSCAASLWLCSSSLPTLFIAQSCTIGSNWCFTWRNCSRLLHEHRNIGIVWHSIFNQINFINYITN